MKYIVTNVQYNAPVNKNFLRNLLTFAKAHKVDKLLTFVQNGSYHEEDEIDQEVLLAGFETISALTLNSNLRLKDMKILAQQINPMTGMATKLSRDYSYIMPSAKIRYQSVANTTSKPRAMMTTGNLTKPNYKLHTAQGQKANEQHQYGFVFVEIKSNQIFTTYQVEATKNGDFHYLDERYVQGKRVKVQPEAIILGDWHTGVTDPKARAHSIATLKALKPKRAVFHDLFDGNSINPHKQGQLLESLHDFATKRDSLDKELKEVFKEVQFFADTFPKIQFVVAESNHDIFLRRYIDGKLFIDNPQNFLHVIKMIPELMLDEKPTLQVGLELFGKLPSNFHFAKEDEEYRVRGVNLSAHQHRGVNGSKGSAISFSNYNLKQIGGHTHSPALFANSMTVGTNTYLKQRYMKGPSSHMHCNGILYADGKFALLPFV
jgi:hypothetical protein